MNDAMLRAACDAERAHDGASPCHFCPERCGNDALSAAIRAAVGEAADEIERLRAGLRRIASGNTCMALTTHPPICARAHTARALLPEDGR